ncbi:IPT/TIG domain-containing protein [Chitinophaga sp. SYP-B3965]|uniref:IPT/TIG domain-containing protein n=1 Tax=Chitinophaga sp. SYP-B3965 TaxID=2663120 RepID=UPI001563CB34|nr:IPT/TIG domain-containing protein [Chitinophaga sp. SYP-B3965]
MKRTIYVCILLGSLLAACTKETVNSNAQGPYGDPVLPAINFAEESAIIPAKGKVGDEVVLKGKGFLAVKDNLKVLFNGTAAPIIKVTDSTITVTVPELGSSGSVSAQIGQEFYFGPYFPVFGPFQMDTIFPSVRGGNGGIFNVIPVPGNKYMIGGEFSEYDNSAIAGGVNRFARINADGTLDRTYAYGTNTGPSGPIYPMVYMADELQYLVGGNFSGYDQVSNVYSIAKVNANGGVSQRSVSRPSGAVTPASALEGGFRGTVAGLFVQSDKKIIAIGGFRYYVRPNYNLTTVESGVDSLHLDSTMVQNIARLHPDGTLDSSYHYDLVNHQGKVTVNGSISSYYMLADDKMLIAGNFTTYGGQSIGRIARLNTDGSLDVSFNPGAGPDQAISDFAVQPDGKIICAGNFKKFSGVNTGGIVRLNADGSMDATFNAGEGADGYVNRLGLIPGGNIIVAGSFRKFGGVTRSNFVVLTPTGAVHKTYNTNGGVTFAGNAPLGQVWKVLPMTGQNALLMIGSFSQFDYRQANRIVRFTYQ